MKDFIKRHVRVFQAMAAVCAILAAGWNVFGRPWMDRIKAGPPMIEAQHFLVTNDRKGLSEYIREGGGAWSRDVDLMGFPATQQWKPGEIGVVGVQFYRHHERCQMGRFVVRLINEFNLAVGLVDINVSTVFAPSGRNTLVSPIMVPIDVPPGEYELYGALTYICPTGEAVTGFPQPRLVVEGG